MLSTALGYAVNSGESVQQQAYSLLIRVGYALRIDVGRYTTAQPLDASAIDPAAVARLASLPRVPDIGTLTTDLSEEDEGLRAPIVALATNTAESSLQFANVVSVEPAFWNAVVSVATAGLQTVFSHDRLIRRPSDLDPDVAESFFDMDSYFVALMKRSESR
jgi:hypothetical protein